MTPMPLVPATPEGRHETARVYISYNKCTQISWHRFAHLTEKQSDVKSHLAVSVKYDKIVLELYSDINY